MHDDARSINLQIQLTERALHSLRDIDGVYGSFLLNATGELRARDLPAVFDDQTLAESGARIARLWEVISDSGPPEYAMLEFSEYSLFLRRVGAGCLCVVVPAYVNVLALRLASKWVARYFEPVAHKNTLIS
jgi:predicted regulator of Ras-like GTPase activity (Roadblock/LC7/MglB family)